MRWGMLLLMAGCVPYRATMVEMVQFHPSSRPIPGAYTVAIPVQATGCEPNVSVADLLAEATGRYDALVQVTIQRVYEQVGVANQPVDDNICWKVEGMAVFFGTVDPDAELRRRQP